jgi:hypothetical protein
MTQIAKGEVRATKTRQVHSIQSVEDSGGDGLHGHVVSCRGSQDILVLMQYLV